MNYYEILNNMIEKSQLTHKEIADKCKSYEQSINPSYISKLRSGKQPPASGEVNKAIAKACGFDEMIDEFLYSAYIEKAPEFIINFLNEITSLFRLTTIQLLKLQNPVHIHPKIDTEVANMSDYEIIKESTSQVKSMLGINLFDSFGDGTESEALIMPDSSMSPRIPKGAVLLVEKTDKINNGDIVVFVNQENKQSVRRYVKLGEKIILLSENLKIKPIEMEIDSLNIIGKVSNITIDL